MCLVLPFSYSHLSHNRGQHGVAGGSMRPMHARYWSGRHYVERIRFRTSKGRGIKRYGRRGSPLGVNSESNDDNLITVESFCAAFVSCSHPYSDLITSTRTHSEIHGRS